MSLNVYGKDDDALLLKLVDQELNVILDSFMIRLLKLESDTGGVWILISQYENAITIGL